MTLELLVAAVLLVTTASLVTTCAYGMRTLARNTRELIAAQHEVENQLEYLVNVQGDEAETLMGDLAVSEFTRELLPNATLQAAIENDEFGKRIRVGISWNAATEIKPVSAVAWLSAVVTNEPVTGEITDAGTELKGTELKPGEAANDAQ